MGWSSGETTRAFLWENGVMSELGTLNGSYSAAIDIDKHGRIFGMGDDDGARPPVVWTRDGVTALPLLPGAVYGVVGRASDRGIVAGQIGYASEDVVPVIWIQGRIVALPSLSPRPNYPDTAEVYDVNNHRQAVGVSNGRAVLWQQR